MTTVTSQFKVRDILEESFELKEMNNGYITFVEHADHLYDDPSLLTNIQDFSTGDIVKLTLKSQNEKNTIWKISHIHKD